ncbi:PepSY domain-containing protein [Streptomyces sp. NPDC088745]|uniref:PepSY domain-containing protein n=1 Tax=Streptomyces sp. NPDC088745 TaxID=3365884 RepID=UPI0037F7689E
MNSEQNSTSNRISPKTHTGLALCGFAAAALLLAGCGNDEPKAQPTPVASDASASATASPSMSASPSSSTAGLTEDQAERQQLVPAAKVDHQKAGTAAEARVSGSKLVSAELKRTRDGAPEWETEVAASDGAVQKVKVDAVSGEAAQPRADADQDVEDRRKLTARLAAAKVTWEKAATTAKDRKQGTVTAVELDDTADGKPLWKVDLVTPGNWDKTTYDIDATDGKVVREHVDRD